jgi:DNA-binding NarL/FixJ family response regulator
MLTPSLHSRILIVEDHQLVAEGLKQLLEPEFNIAGILTSHVDIVRCAQAWKPDVILCSTSVPLMDVLPTFKRADKIFPKLKIIYLSFDTDPNLAIEAFDRGSASGYLLKTCSTLELRIAIRTVLRGQSYIAPSLQNIVTDLRWEKRMKAHESESLTEREREVLRVLLKKSNMKMAASVLGLTPRTVAFHKYRIMDRIGAKSSVELIRFAIRNRLVPEAELTPEA